MRRNQISDVNIVSDTGTIISQIVCSKHLHSIALASGHFNRNFDQMGCWFSQLPSATGRIRPGNIEVTQPHIGQIIRL